MKLITTCVAAAFGVFWVTLAVEALPVRNWLIERQLVTNPATMPLGSHDYRVGAGHSTIHRRDNSGEDVTPASSAMDQASGAVHELTSQTSEDEQDRGLLEARGKEAAPIKLIGLDETMESLNTPLIEHTGSLSDLVKHKDKHALADAASGSSSHSDGNAEMRRPDLRTGQRELAKAQVEAREALDHAVRALNNAESQVIVTADLHKQAVSEVEILQANLEKAENIGQWLSYRTPLYFARHEEQSTKEAAEEALATRKERAKDVQDKEAAEKGTSAASGKNGMGF